MKTSIERAKKKIICFFKGHQEKMIDNMAIWLLAGSIGLPRIKCTRCGKDLEENVKL